MADKDGRTTCVTGNSVTVVHRSVLGEHGQLLEYIDADADAPVLASRSDPAEAATPYGALRRLLAGGAVPSVLAAERDVLVLLLARTASGGTGPASQRDVQEVDRRVLALWRELGAGAPVYLLLDDVEWADPASVATILRALRDPGLAGTVHLVVGLTGAVRTANHVDELLAHPEVRWVSADRLNAEDVRAVLARDADAALVRPDIVDAVLEQTGGEALCVHAMADQMAGQVATTNDELVEILLRSSPAFLVDVVAGRLRGFDGAILELLRALAVLRRPLPWHRARLLLDRNTRYDRYLHALQALGLVAHGPVIVKPPVLARALRDSLPDHLRERLERRAFEILVDNHAPADLLGEHLLAMAVPADLREVELLEAAARGTMAPTTAARLLHLALRGPLGPDHRRRLLAAVGETELRFDTRSALVHVREALALTTESLERVRLTLVASHALVVAGDSDSATRILLDELDRSDLPGDHPLVGALRADAYFVSLGTREQHLDVAARVLAPAVGGSGGRRAASERSDAMLVAARGMHEAWQCRPAGLVLDDITPALIHGPRNPPERSMGILLAGSVLLWADSLAGAEIFYEDASSAARMTGSRLDASIALWMRGSIALRRGCPTLALELAEQAAYAAHDEGWGMWRHAHLVVRLPALRILGRGVEAMDELRRVKGAKPLPDHWLAQALRTERARLRLDAGDAHGALVDAQEAAAGLAAVGCINPAVAGCGIVQASALRAMGRTTEALDVLEVELERARRWGARSTIASVLTHRAALLPPDLALAEFDEAVALLADEAFPLELAYALHERARLFAVADNRADAHADLGRAARLARAAGAAQLASSLHGEMGGTSGTAGPEGTEVPVTVAELRVARLAANGRSNEEISRKLYLARRTVETHLTSIYRKLGIRGRKELGSALGPLRAIPHEGIAPRPGS